MRRPRAEPPAYRLPQPPAPPPAPDSFVYVPISALPAVSPEQRRVQFWLYYLALDEAQAVVRPSLPERDLLGVWN
jgi:hypothetical protein